MAIIIWLFWAISTWGLDRLPVIHNDETAIAAAGYQLFDQGQYGLDMYTGHEGRETIYLEVLPLMPWVQGASSWLIGAGVWQMRFGPVLCGVLTLALTYTLARQLANRQTALLALVLLLFWRWSPLAINEFHLTGIPLVDAVRVARYDILIAPLSVAILWLWLRAQATGQQKRYLLAGIFVGLTGLTNLYGFFWLPAIVLLLPINHFLQKQPASTLLKPAFALFVGVGLAFLPWLLMVATHPTAFASQFSMHGSRFNLLEAQFYLENIRLEGGRYLLGLTRPDMMTRLGFWLVLALPVVLMGLGVAWARGRNAHSLTLFIPTTLFPILFALLIQKKVFGYLLMVMPLWIIALAWGATWLWGRSTSRGRVGLTLLTVWLVLEGSLALLYLPFQSARTPAATPFFAQLREVVPEQGVILGPQTYWPGLYDRDYRSMVLVFSFGIPHRSALTAMTLIDPDVVIMNPTMVEWLASHDRNASPPDDFMAEFGRYMEGAELIGELQEPSGDPVWVYQLK